MVDLEEVKVVETVLVLVAETMVTEMVTVVEVLETELVEFVEEHITAFLLVKSI